MIDKDDEKKTQAIIEDNICTDPIVRRTVLSMFAEAIQEANVYGRDKWAIRVSKDAVRLVVGHYYVFTIREEGVWIALDDRFMKAGDYYPTLSELSEWGWKPDEQDQPGAYPTYKDRSRRIDFSRNGYYTIGANHEQAWPHIRRLFFDFIYKAACHGQPMAKESPGLHSQGTLKYVRHYLGVNLPDPLY